MKEASENNDEFTKITFLAQNDLSKNRMNTDQSTVFVKTYTDF